MSIEPELPLIAILNTSEDIIAMLTEIMEEEGFRVVSDFIVAYRRGEKDIADFFRTHRPQVVIYDVGLPYTENWAFFQSVRAMGLAKPCAFVVTSTNTTALEALVGAAGSCELIGRPFDLERIVDAVKRAVTC